MGIQIRLPNITGASEKEQLAQLKSYLYQLSEELQWAFDNIDTQEKKITQESRALNVKRFQFANCFLQAREKATAEDEVALAVGEGSLYSKFALSSAHNECAVAFNCRADTIERKLVAS